MANLSRSEKKNITIVDIAKEAGVSIATVSRVLTGNAKVNEEKKQRINEIIKKYDFHPNVLARGLIQTKTNTIGILTADIRNPYYSSLFVSCENAAADRGYSLLLCNSFSDRLKEFELIDNLANQKVDAIILIGGAPDELETDLEYVEKVNKITNSIPVIVTGRLDGTNCTRINIDYLKSISLVMEYISQNKNFKKIAFIGGSQKVTSSVELRNGFKKMLSKLNLKYYPEFDVPNNRYDDQGGYDAMNQILNLKERPDVVIAVNDITAVGAMHAINEHNLKIPDDISIITFDDTFIASLMNPALTSVSYNYVSFGYKIIETTINLIEQKEVEPITLIQPKLVVRESCKKT